MRDNLVGYLLGALEPSEHEAVEAQLAIDFQLRHELELISRAVRPLAADKAYYDPPAGLAERTCVFVAAQSYVGVAGQPAFESSRWRLADIAVAAGIFLAATLLFFPAVNQSRFAARSTTCQNNLRQIGVAAAEYGLRFGNYFPMLPADDGPADAGAVAARLIEHRYLSSPTVLICPASELAEELNRTGQYPWPPELIEELKFARGDRQLELHRIVGGSYAYNVGYVIQGQYHPTKNQRRPTFALVADAPCGGLPLQPVNHDRKGVNILYEDGHVRFQTGCKARGCQDHIFTNDNGEQAPGLHRDDSVLGPGGLRIAPQQVSREK